MRLNSIIKKEQRMRKECLFTVMLVLMTMMGLTGCSEEKEVMNDGITGCFLVRYHATSNNFSWVEVIDYPKNAPSIFERRPFLKFPANNLGRDNAMPSPGDIFSISIKHWEKLDDSFTLGLHLLCEVEYCKQ